MKSIKIDTLKIQSDNNEFKVTAEVENKTITLYEINTSCDEWTDPFTIIYHKKIIQAIKTMNGEYISFLLDSNTIFIR